MMRFDHGRLRLEIDERTGSITEIIDSASGRTHFRGSAEGNVIGRLFRVILPVDRWSSHAADSWRNTPTAVERSSDQILIRYADLLTPGGPSGVSAEVLVQRGGPSEALLKLRLESRRADGDVTDVLFPWLCGWRSEGGASDAVTLGGVRSVAPGTFPVNRGMTFSRWHQREYFTYPIDLYAPWIDIGGTGAGVSLISYQRRARNLGAFIENLAGYGPGADLSIGFNHYQQLSEGMHWESPPIGISVHDGDWHAAADRYSAWVDTWFEPPPTPEWARRTIGFQNVLFRGFDGTPIRPLESMPEVAAAGVRAGVPHLSVWDYVLLGEYGKLHDVPLHGFAGNDAARLRAALAASRRAGARLSALQNFRLVKPTSRLFIDSAHDEVCRRYDGSNFVEEYPGSLSHAMVITSHVGPMVHPVDARLASVRSRVLGLIDASLALGFDSHFYDQPFENWPSYHPGRGDDGPDGAHAGTVELLKIVRERIAEQSPDGIVVGEYCDVFASEGVDLWMSWYTEFEDLRRSIYAIPQTLQSWVVDNDPAAATRAFVIGAQLCLTTHGGEGHLGDVPVFADHVRRLADLRSASPRIWSGRYRDRDGFDLVSDGPAIAGSFWGPAGVAVVVGSPGGASRAMVLPERDRLGPSRRGARIVRWNGQAEQAGGGEIAITLAENEVAVIEF